MTSCANNMAIIITTYKRNELLRTLLDSIAELTLQPGCVMVIDNAHDELTRTMCESIPCSRYFAMDRNLGGAGGFSYGIEQAYQRGFEWFWLMDDDVKVLPDAIEALSVWMKQTEAALVSGRPLSDTPTIYQGFRKNFDGTFFYWQYRFLEHLGIPNPIAPSAFKSNETSRTMNTACFEGSLIHKSIVEKIGLPDARFFIYWDDTIYGYLASKHTKLLLVPDYILQRTRRLENVKIGRVRKLNSTSDVSRYHIMKNRGHMAHYLKLNGDYSPLIFTLGTFLTFIKEFIRLFITHSFKTGLPKLFFGMKDAKMIRKDTSWKPYSEIRPLGAKAKQANNTANMSYQPYV